MDEFYAISLLKVPLAESWSSNHFAVQFDDHCARIEIEMLEEVEQRGIILNLAGFAVDLNRYRLAHGVKDSSMRSSAEARSAACHNAEIAATP